MQPVLENNENLESSLEKQESDILKEIERVMTNLRNEQTRLGEERKSLKEERRATVFERRSERIPSGDENVLVSALQAFAVQAEELKGKLRVSCCSSLLVDASICMVRAQCAHYSEITTKRGTLQSFGRG